ncbi:Nif3-like dinuclear metal center hexameric protein [Helcobacillus massiliensis]|uniref:GTP cyclohydrolase 1 type 2 homolog n=1 Tax=Helcobacillus massiliensis TaxID=521392 RepID=A0A839QQ93_9MICO|nr:Nif3-like dinuclear metal center hexameric protein [Helcobacillus massiliensis]MBB3022494.1 dinuclear metal center YbgI/SA1388 family protein [Helcobacillus massiliensis]MCT1557129.1 Nif3-like dinuclear metal center hexameric protein [Helcobacillus massiliensis]MCT2036136.1 Nif3-like dinuclear metal center hexameric protein [Helcobacillus massiliensis]MCT2331267.1 Nif3-like dinuclear metal center hexameric protein [Helcobacillus massiliensis]
MTAETAPDPAEGTFGHNPIGLTLGAVQDVLEDAYPLDWAEDWDRVGLVAGVRDEPVRRVLLTVDPTLAVVREAREIGADLIIAHHPLLLKPVSFLPAHTGKGAVITELIRSRIGLWCGHTNVDRSIRGTVGGWLRVLDLEDPQPLAASGADSAREDLFGLGAVGALREPTTVRELAENIAARVPATAQGIRFTGDGDRPVRRVAVCPGSGDSFLSDATAAGVDGYVTSDLRHHPASEHLESAADETAVPALIDVAHSASESLWLPLAKELLAERLPDLEVRISSVSTDPFTGRVG